MRKNQFNISTIFIVFMLSIFDLKASGNDLPLENITRDNILKPYTNFLVNPDFFLRPIFPQDDIPLRNLFMNEDLMKYFRRGEVYTRKQLEMSVTSLAHEHLSNSADHWVLITPDGIVGVILTWLDQDDNIREIAYGTHKKGFVTEASKLVIGLLGGVFKATVHPENLGSIKVLKNLGFTPIEGQQEIFIEKYNAPRNHYIRFLDE